MHTLPRSGLLLTFASAALLLLAACGTTREGSLDPLDTSAPGWSVRQGQALWQPAGKSPEIAGDVVISSHPSAGSYVQFSKTLPILSGRIGPSGWQFETIPENKHYSGRGQPPRRIVWLQLLRAMEGQEISDRWSVARPSDNFIALEDTHRGERLEIRLQ